MFIVAMVVGRPFQAEECHVDRLCPAVCLAGLRNDATMRITGKGDKEENGRT